MILVSSEVWGFDEFLFETQDQAVLASLWDTVFTERPTLEDLKNGTPKTSPVIGIKMEFERAKGNMAARRGIEPLLPE